MDLRMGIHIGDLGEHLVGLVQVSHISLAQGENLPDSPDVFALGYWIVADSAGKGYTTACCLALMEYARDKLGAKQFLSATHPMNRSSARVLDKLGFSVYEESEDRFRYKLQLEENS